MRQKKSRWYLTFLPNGAAEDEEETDNDDHDDDSDITIHSDVAVYLYQVSTYENYVNSLKFKISFLKIEYFAKAMKLMLTKQLKYTH